MFDGVLAVDVVVTVTDPDDEDKDDGGRLKWGFKTFVKKHLFWNSLFLFYLIFVIFAIQFTYLKHVSYKNNVENIYTLTSFKLKMFLGEIFKL